MSDELKVRTREQALAQYPYLKDLDKELAKRLMLDLLKFMLTKDTSIMEALAVIGLS